MSVYCGAAEPSGKQRRGTMQQCYLKKQIRYYGIKKVLGNEYKGLEDYLKYKTERSKLIRKSSKISGRLKYLTKAIKYEKDTKHKNLLKKEYKKLVSEYNNIMRHMNAMEALKTKYASMLSRSKSRPTSRSKSRSKSRPKSRSKSRAKSRSKSRSKLRSKSRSK